MRELIKINVEQRTDALNRLLDLHDDLRSLADRCVRAIKNGGTIYTFGNGGSASDAQHFVAELIGRLDITRRAYPAICLNTDTSVLTCIANDFGYSEVCRRQISALARPNDEIILISTSGSSENIQRAVEYAEDEKLSLTLLTSEKCEYNSSSLISLIKVPSHETAIIQELHIFSIHMICTYIQKQLEKQNDDAKR